MGTPQNAIGMEAIAISPIVMLKIHPGLGMVHVLIGIQHTIPPNVGGMEATALLMASHPLRGGTIIPIVMLIGQTILGMDGLVMVEHTIPPNAGGMEAIACSSMKTTQTAMLFGQN